MTERENDLAWRVERALLHAWPAIEEYSRGDWLVRLAPGVSRRSNAANPTRADLRNIDADIAACEALYRAHSAPAMFRLPTIVDPAADRRLARLNYVVEDEVATLYASSRTRSRRFTRSSRIRGRRTRPSK
jgi:hypothetical protein